MKKINKIILIIVSLFVFTGCTITNPFVPPINNVITTNNTIFIPESLFIRKKVKAPSKPYTEEKVSKYILELYSAYAISNSNIKQIKKIVDKYNKKQPQTAIK